MKFVCIQACFDGEQMWEIGQERESDTDLSQPSKKGENVSWERTDIGTDDAKTGEKKTVRELMKMSTGKLVLYANARFKGTKLDKTLTKTAMLREIKTLEDALEEEEEFGFLQ